MSDSTIKLIVSNDLTLVVVANPDGDHDLTKIKVNKRTYVYDADTDSYTRVAKQRRAASPLADRPCGLTERLYQQSQVVLVDDDDEADNAADNAADEAADDADEDEKLLLASSSKPEEV